MAENSITEIADAARALAAEQQSNANLFELLLVLLIITFAIFAFHYAYKLMSAGFDSISIMRTVGIICIVFSSLLLVLLGYSKEQINVVLALFGTIAGYLLGRSDNNGSQSKDEESSVPAKD